MNIGLDVGYSSVKAISGDRRVTFASVVGTPDTARFSLNGAETNIILTEPDHVLVGAGAILQSRHLHRREDRGWIESAAWHHLMLAALTELSSATTVELNVVTGLPIAFYGDRDQLRDRLLGQHRVQRDGARAQLFKIVSARVIPQPFGALLALSLDDHGRIVDPDLAAAAVGVVDVGGKTTNLLSVNRLSEISRETASVSAGVWDVARAVRNHLSDHCPALELRDHQVLDIIAARQVKYYGRPVQLAAVVDAALEPLASQVIAQATQLWNGGAALDTILVTGGGALLLGPAIERHFRHARVVDDPIFANATGFWRLAQRLEG
jgi:plasmid segregation protein ParM